MEIHFAQHTQTKQAKECMKYVQIKFDLRAHLICEENIATHHEGFLVWRRFSLASEPVTIA